LNQSIIKYEKFVRECADYFQFRDRIKAKGLQLSAPLQPNPPSVPEEQDSQFNLKFIKRLIDDSQSLDIEISKESFNLPAIRDELVQYEAWRQGAEQVLKKLESEFSRRSELQLSGELYDQF
jgi:hypothetical protein